MRINFPGWLLVRVACVTALASTFAACSESGAAGAVPNKAASTSHGTNAGTYVLITQVRPEDPAKYFPQERWGYGGCVAVAKSLKIAVKPFPALPQDFVSERITYASDGKRTLFQKVLTTLVGNMTPYQGCELRLVSMWNASVTSNGQNRSANQDTEGKVHFSETEAPLEEPVRASLLASYTFPKRLNGTQVKCDSKGGCIVDPDVVMVKQGPRPVRVSYRIDDPGTHGTALIIEPVSLTVGTPVNPALFSLERAQ